MESLVSCERLLNEQTPEREKGVAHVRPGQLWYFTYGGGLNARHLLPSGITPNVVRVVALYGYRMGFYGRMPMWDSGMETLVAEHGQIVWGVLHEVSLADSDRFDAVHDVRFDGTGSYFHYPVTVRDADGNAYAALACKKTELGELAVPSREYLDFLLAGGREHGLPGDYLARLSELPCRDSAYPVPRTALRTSPFARDPFASDCSGCDG